MAITEKQYQLTSEELAAGTAGIETYKARIAALRAAETPTSEPTPGPVTPPVTRDASLGDEFITPNAGVNVDEAKIREERRQAAQAAINVQQELFNRLAGQAREEGAKRAAETRGINVRSGLSGSSFATQAAVETEAKTAKIIESIERERAATIQNILAVADQGAIEEARARRAEALGQAEYSLKARQANYEKAKNILSGAGAQGVTATQLKQKDPARYQTLVNQMGSELEVQAALLGGVKPDDVLFKDTVGNKAVIVTRDKAGKINKEIIDLGNALGSSEKLEVIDGIPYAQSVDASGNITLRKVAGFQPKDKGILESGSAVQIADAIMQPNSGLNLDDVPIKNRAAVSQELNKRKAEALKSNNIDGIIKASAGGKPVSDTFTLAFEKSVNVLSQINDLQTTIEDQATGPIWGLIRSNNPFDQKAREIKARLQSIVPNLARGVYGEVGVLTDNDIKLYSQTLPNLTSQEELRDVLLGIAVRSVQRSLENKIKTQAGLGRNVSGIGAFYNEIKTRADQLLANVESGLSFTTPDGQTFKFPSQKALDKFKKEAGL